MGMTKIMLIANDNMWMIKSLLGKMNCFLIVLLVNKLNQAILQNLCREKSNIFSLQNRNRSKHFFAGRIKEKKKALIG